VTGVTGVADAQADRATRATPAGARRLAIFTSHPIQYQAPFFRALAAGGEVIPTVYFGSRHGLDVSMDAGFGTAFRWDVPLLDGYEHVFLPNRARHPDVSRFGGVRVTGMGRELAHSRPDALLVLGWQTAAHVQAVRAAWAAGIPVIVRGESTLQRGTARGARGLARRVLWLPARQRLYAAAFARVAAFLVIGSRNRDYYRAFGVPEAKLHWAPYGVDNDWFRLAEPARASARARIRARLGVPDAAIVFASSAKLIERKRPFDLVAAVAQLRRDGVDARALFIGDGEQRPALEHRAKAAGIAESMLIAGFVNQAELPAWYAAADALVLPSDSRETWGLVVNEAMAAGLPVIVSDAAGCAPDLVAEGENGFTYACGDVHALAERLARVAALGADGRRALGDRSREIVGRFSVDVAARATAAAVNAACRQPVARRRA
jgi:glycosyltransferase involved in cell wall biosynthesis